MKNYLLLLILLLVGEGLLGQNNKQTATISNEYRTNISSAYGYPSYHPYEYAYYFEEGDTIYNLQELQAVWFGATYQDTLRMAISWFNMSDFFPGSIDSVSHLPYFENYWEDIKLNWKFTRDEILTLKESADQGPISSDQLSEDILSYPAINNSWYITKYGFTFEEDTAPFYDRNEDGIYDPLDGDHPVPYSENTDFIPHEFSYVVYNDIANLHVASQSQKAGIEVHQINYLLDSKKDIADKALFTRLIIKNKGEGTLQNARFGLLNELEHDIGRLNGVSRELNAVYYYGGVVYNPYIDSTAICVTKFLNQPISNYINILNEGIGDPPPATTTPRIAKEIFNYLNGKWRDGTPLTYGNFGYNPGSTDTVSLQFHDIPTDPGGWSMWTINPPFYDYYSLPSFDIGQLEPNEEYTIDFTTLIIHDTTTSEEYKLDNLVTYLEEIELSYKDAITQDSTSNTNNFINEKQTLLYPNPVMNILNIKTGKPIRKMSVYGLDGRFYKTINYPIESINLKDCPSGILLIEIEFDREKEIYWIMKV